MQSTDAKEEGKQEDKPEEGSSLIDDVTAETNTEAKDGKEADKDGAPVDKKT